MILHVLSGAKVTVPITPRSFFFRLHVNRSLHLFETHWAFLPLFNIIEQY